MGRLEIGWLGCGWRHRTLAASGYQYCVKTVSSEPEQTEGADRGSMTRKGGAFGDDMTGENL
jgi:hypothetical protein